MRAETIEKNQNITAQLRKIPLSYVMSRLGYEKDINLSDYKSDVYKTGAGKIDITGKQFKNWTTGAGGGEAIDLMMSIQGVIDLKNPPKGAFMKARTELLKLVDGKDVETIMLEVNKEKEAQRREAPKVIDLVAEFKMPERDDSRIDKVINYLHDIRKIPKTIISASIKAGYLYATAQYSYTNCVFVHKDVNKKHIGCSLRGTKPGADGRHFKGCRGSRTKGWFMCGVPIKTAERVVLVESAIDALSYLALHPDSEACVVSLAGNSCPAELIEGHDLQKKEIIWALDNDEAGNNQFIELQRLLPQTKISREAPVHKDWNEDLVSQGSE
jgi:hypothetical protein